MAIQDAEDLLWPVVAKTILALKLGPEDAAAAKAAVMIAENIDEHPDKVYAMRWLMPELLKYLVELGATPASRAAIAGKTKNGGENAPAPVSKLDTLRTARAARRPAGA